MQTISNIFTIISILTAQVPFFDDPNAWTSNESDRLLTGGTPPSNQTFHPPFNNDRRHSIPCQESFHLKLSLFLDQQLSPKMNDPLLPKRNRVRGPDIRNVLRFSVMGRKHDCSFSTVRVYSGKIVSDVFQFVNVLFSGCYGFRG